MSIFRTVDCGECGAIAFVSRGDLAATIVEVLCPSCAGPRYRIAMAGHGRPAQYAGKRGVESWTHIGKDLIRREDEG